MQWSEPGRRFGPPWTIGAVNAPALVENQCRPKGKLAGATAWGAEHQRQPAEAPIADLGGAVLSLQQVGTFTDGMTGGRGYLALASLIVARWNPLGAALACLACGAAEASNYGYKASAFPSIPMSSRWRLT